MLSLVPPTARYSTNQAIAELAQELGLRDEPYMQDWEWEVANPLDIEKYIQHFLSLTDEHKRFTLMEIIIQAVTDQERVDDFFKYWKCVRPLLEANFSLHEWSIWYWSLYNSADLADCWLITPYMRDLWYRHNSSQSDL